MPRKPKPESVDLDTVADLETAETALIVLRTKFGYPGVSYGSRILTDPGDGSTCFTISMSSEERIPVDFVKATQTRLDGILATIESIRSKA